MELETEASLTHAIIAKLRLCGHIMYHRMGGKTGRRRVLAILLDRKEILQKELQDILEIQSGSLSEMIIRMEEDGLIEKVKSETDGRHFILRLTLEGRRQAERSKDEYNRQIAQMMSCFSTDQMRQLDELLDIMVEHWRSMEKNKKLNILGSQNNE